MNLKFAKMHGLGNDFMVVDQVTQNFELTPEHVRRWGDRKTGVGFDQLLVIAPPTDPAADFRYLIYNGGTPRYRQRLMDVAEDHYRGFEFS